MLTTIDKAIVALIGSILSILAAFNIQVDWATPELVGTIGSVITALLTWLIPNKAKPQA